MANRFAIAVMFVSITFVACAASCDRSNISQPRSPSEGGLGVANAQTTQPAESSKGDKAGGEGGNLAGAKKNFAARCAACHGDVGKGNGPAAAALFPKPRNFHSPDQMKQLTDEQLFDIIKNGKPGTAMAAFGNQFSDEEIKKLVELIRSWGEQ